jgi:hypothetical protein
MFDYLRVIAAENTDITIEPMTAVRIFYSDYISVQGGRRLETSTNSCPSSALQKSNDAFNQLFY